MTAFTYCDTAKLTNRIATALEYDKKMKEAVDDMLAVWMNHIYALCDTEEQRRELIEKITTTTAMVYLMGYDKHVAECEPEHYEDPDD